MHNFSDKARDLARSVLASTSRQTAREHKAASARRASNRRLEALVRCGPDFDNYEGDLCGYRFDRGDFGWYWSYSMVQDRRDADKVGPLQRWAQAQIERDPVLADGDYWTRHDYFAALLGDTVPGRHALSHITFLFGPRDHYDLLHEERHETWQRQLEAEAAAVAARRARLVEVLAGADAGRLNRRIPALTPPGYDTVIYANSWHRRPAGGPVPWLFDGDIDDWLTAAGDPVMAAVAFDALDQVHAEMFGT